MKEIILTNLSDKNIERIARIMFAFEMETIPAKNSITLIYDEAHVFRDTDVIYENVIDWLYPEMSHFEFMNKMVW